jgi:hypothetical protein
VLVGLGDCDWHCWALLLLMVLYSVTLYAGRSDSDSMTAATTSPIAHQRTSGVVTGSAMSVASNGSQGNLADFGLSLVSTDRPANNNDDDEVGGMVEL